MIFFIAPRSHGAQAVEISFFVAHHADQIDLAHLFLAGGQRGGGNFNGVIVCALAARQGFQNPARLFPTAAAEFGNLHRRRQASHNFRGMLLEQARVGAGQAVFGQDADGFKERGAEFVVQIFRGQFALAVLRQAGAHVGGKLHGVPRGLQRIW